MAETSSVVPSFDIYSTQPSTAFPITLWRAGGCTFQAPSPNFVTPPTAYGSGRHNARNVTCLTNRSCKICLHRHQHARHVNLSGLLFKSKEILTGLKFRPCVRGTWLRCLIRVPRGVGHLIERHRLWVMVDTWGNEVWLPWCCADHSVSED